jgi:hypothetical protein
MIPGKMDGYSEFLHIVTETVNHQQNFLNKKKLVQIPGADRVLKPHRTSVTYQLVIVH